MKRFAMRWFVSSLGLWIAAGLLGAERIAYDGMAAIIIAGLVLAVVNGIIKPLVVILSLPAILFTLGLFMLVINGFMVMLASWLYGGLQVTNLWAAVLAGMVIGLVNYLVNVILEDRK
ncbi:hypothetical protein CR970_03500 [Candidatus Saccharibacteria bacterium]|nr:MAG: hypothetical protein CR970_03500 [Candidatus Saccharibacteria bacterium]